MAVFQNKLEYGNEKLWSLALWCTAIKILTWRRVVPTGDLQFWTLWLLILVDLTRLQSICNLRQMNLKLLKAKNMKCQNVPWITGIYSSFCGQASECIPLYPGIRCNKCGYSRFFVVVFGGVGLQIGRLACSVEM